MLPNSIGEAADLSVDVFCQGVNEALLYDCYFTEAISVASSIVDGTVLKWYVALGHATVHLGTWSP